MTLFEASLARLRTRRARTRSRTRRGPLVVVKIVAALGIALAVSSGVTALLESRLTRRALREQAGQVVGSHLAVLRAVYAQQEIDLLGDMRLLAQDVELRGLDEPDRRDGLLVELGRAQRTLGLDFIVLDVGGPEPVAAAGFPLPEVTAAGRPADSSVRLLPAGEGRYVQAATVPLGGEGVVLAGGYEFDDGLAYLLRRGGGYDVLLVAGGRLLGGTLPQRLQAPPLAGPTGELPEKAGVVRLNGVDTMVQYVAVSRPSANSPVSAALGVAFALPEPVGALDRSLARVRLAGSVLLGLLSLLLSWVFFSALTRPLVGLTRTAQRIAGGDLEATFEAHTRDEVGVLARALERMRAELGSQLDVIRRQAEALRQSSQRIAGARDEERRRLAMDLHDGIQQQLVVLRMRMGLGRDRAAANPGEAAAVCEELGVELDAVIQRLREVSHDIYPSILVDRGLGAAVRSYAGRIPLSTRLVSEPDPLPRLQPEVENTAYFLICEAVTNALKHARASALSIQLRLRDGWLGVAVVDDGIGLGMGSGEGRGLVHMQDRVRSFGGELTVERGRGGGVEMRAHIPVGEGGSLGGA